MRRRRRRRRRSEEEAEAAAAGWNKRNRNPTWQFGELYVHNIYITYTSLYFFDIIIFTYFYRIF